MRLRRHHTGHTMLTHRGRGEGAIPRRECQACVRAKSIMNSVARSGKSQPTRRKFTANPHVRTAPALATIQCTIDIKKHPMMSPIVHQGRCLFQVLDLNQRSLRDGFTVRSLCPLGQPGLLPEQLYMIAPRNANTVVVGAVATRRA